jgi:hypothetical protein
MRASIARALSGSRPAVVFRRFVQLPRALGPGDGSHAIARHKPSPIGPGFVAARVQCDGGDPHGSGAGAGPGGGLPKQLLGRGGARADVVTPVRQVGAAEPRWRGCRIARKTSSEQRGRVVGVDGEAQQVTGRSFGRLRAERPLVSPAGDLGGEPAVAEWGDDQPAARVGGIGLGMAGRAERHQAVELEVRAPLGALDDVVDLEGALAVAGLAPSSGRAGTPFVGSLLARYPRVLTRCSLLREIGGFSRFTGGCLDEPATE